MSLPYKEAKRRFEASYFEALLAETGGNVSEAARRADIDRSNFRRAARKAGVKTPRSKS